MNHSGAMRCPSLPLNALVGSPAGPQVAPDLRAAEAGDPLQARLGGPAARRPRQNASPCAALPKGHGNVIALAGTLIREARIAEASQQLLDAYSRSDGNPRPPDWVTGAAASELAAMIQNLRADLG